MAKKDHSLVSSDYVHLHNHTQYSLLDGLTKIPALVDHIKSMGMSAVAITDHGTLSGAIEFYQAANKKGIKPIIGMEAYISSRKHTDKDPAHDKKYYHLILLAQSYKGYQNLMRLSTIANLDGFYYKPRIDHDLLEKYNEGIIVLSGCISSEVGDALRSNQYSQAKKLAQWYKSVFGDRYYMEIQDHGHPKHPSSWDEQKNVNDQIIKLASELDIPPVITGDAHYLYPTDQEAHEILLCVQTAAFLSDENRMSLKEFELHVADPKEVIDRWGKECPEGILNTKAIADRCNIEIPLGNYLIPNFAVPEGETEKSYLGLLTFRGLVHRYLPELKPAKTLVGLKKQLSKELRERAEYELGVIGKMDFNGYFLIVADFITWGKDQGIVFGPGRGSGAGSIVAYALRITELDPLKYDLLFERFLNPDRISMPDFDIDIQDTRRDEVIQYCIDKYGETRVANIVTFGRMAARNAVRDVARVLQVPYSEADRLAKMIPPPVQGRHILLAKSLKENTDLKREYRENKQARKVFDLAVNLEGTIRSHGVHAAGVVIAPDDITKFTPLEMAQKGVVSTQYSMGPIEEIGLLKMDFLGLSNLTIIKNALRIIKKVYGKDLEISLIPLDDAKTYELFQRGDTTGVFQFESAGMKRYLKDLQPTLFDDLIAMNALYRPGPMQWINDFIARKHGYKEIEYMHPAMEPTLKNTYGVIVYQEQVMQISKEMCGFTGGQADTLRKAIGKKNPEVLAKLETDFIEGAMKKVGADRKVMVKFWKQLEEFAAYCFNKAHSACYATIAYWTAYLKAHYPAAFMAALMTSDYDDIDRLAIEINECRNMGIRVLPPDVQESFLEFAVVEDAEGEAIRFGMNAIKNVGKGAVEEILRARAVDGNFKGLEDFLAKVNSRTVNRKTLESLIKAGALDSFSDRSSLFHSIDIMLGYSSRLQKAQGSGQTDLFDSPASDVSFAQPKLALDHSNPPIVAKEQLTWERELLGIYLTKHPLSDYQDILREQCFPLADITVGMDGKSVKVGGSINDKREIVTKNGQKMAFVKITDGSREIEVVVFPSIYKKTIDVWERDNVIMVDGKISTKDRGGAPSSEIKILADRAQQISLNQADSVRQPKSGVVPVASDEVAPKKDQKKRIYIRVHDTKDQGRLTSLKDLIDSSAGSIPVVLVIGEDASKKIVQLPSSVDPAEKFLESLNQLFGTEAVKYQ